MKNNTPGAHKRQAAEQIVKRLNKEVARARHAMTWREYRDAMETAQFIAFDGKRLADMHDRQEIDAMLDEMNETRTTYPRYSSMKETA